MPKSCWLHGWLRLDNGFYILRHHQVQPVCQRLEPAQQDFLDIFIRVLNDFGADDIEHMGQRYFPALRAGFYR
jgi:hypothetical protein